MTTDVLMVSIDLPSNSSPPVGHDIPMSESGNSTTKFSMSYVPIVQLGYRRV